MMNNKILVIDDERTIRSSFPLALEDTEFQVCTAPSGEKGFEMLSQEKFDLIYLDLKMPGMNGVQTLRRLRNLDKEIPVYIITAFHGEFIDELKEAEKDGIHFELVKKPIEMDDIIAITRGILDGPGEY